MSLEIDTIIKDSVLAYLKRVVAHADAVLLHRSIISKGQLLRYVQSNRDNAEDAIKQLESLVNPQTKVKNHK